MTGETEPPEALVARYAAALSERMAERAAALRALFDGLDPASLPQGTVRLCLECWPDSPPFAITAFAMDEAACDLEDDTGALEALNEGLERLTPLISEEEQDGFMLWEEDPKWGRVLAEDQPTDMLDLLALAAPRLSQASAGFAARFGGAVVFGLHDHREETLHAGAGQAGAAAPPAERGGLSALLRRFRRSG